MAVWNMGTELVRAETFTVMHVHVQIQRFRESHKLYCIAVACQLLLPSGRALDVATHVTIVNARVNSWPSQEQESEVRRRIEDAFRHFPWSVEGKPVPLYDAEDLPHRLLLYAHKVSPLLYLLTRARERLLQSSGGPVQDFRRIRFQR